MMVCEHCHSEEQQVTQPDEVKRSLTYLTHHVYRILLALHVPVCTCEVCATQHQAQNDLILQTASQNGLTNGDHTPTIESNGFGMDLNESNGSVPSRGEELAEQSPDVMVEEPEVQIHSNGVAASPEPSLQDNRWVKMFADASAAMSQASAVGLFERSPTSGRPRGRPPGSGMGQVGRKSKYCTAAQKAAVAQYAAKFGASAAARKFNIPPAVASYYHRKIYKRSLPKGRRPRFDSPLTIGSHDDVLTYADDSVGAENGDSKPGPEEESPSPSVYRMPSSKGRGRPKLIGDDLDAKLMEYLLQLRRKTGQRFNADTVLMLAMDFVRQNSQGLLVEDGGTVQLRLSWAMKVLARLNETERALRNAEFRPVVPENEPPVIDTLDGIVDEEVKVVPLEYEQSL